MDSVVYLSLKCRHIIITTKTTVLSSANKTPDNVFILACHVNNKGPRILPCGTPQLFALWLSDSAYVRSVIDVIQILSILVTYFLSDKYEFRIFKALPRNSIPTFSVSSLVLFYPQNQMPYSGPWIKQLPTFIINVSCEFLKEINKPYLHSVFFWNMFISIGITSPAL